MTEIGDQEAQVGHQVATPIPHKIHGTAHRGTHQENENQGHETPIGIADQGLERGPGGENPLETEIDQGADQGETHMFKIRLVTQMSPRLRHLLLCHSRYQDLLWDLLQ
jgi:hypothetical protein